MTAANRSSDTNNDNCTDCDALVATGRRKSLTFPRSAGVAATNLPPSSAKIRKILELLGDIEERDEEEKTIIFSQFTSMLDLIEPFLKAEGIKYVRCKLKLYSFVEGQRAELVLQMTAR